MGSVIDSTSSDSTLPKRKSGNGDIIIDFLTQTDVRGESEEENGTCPGGFTFKFSQTTFPVLRLYF